MQLVMYSHQSLPALHTSYTRTDTLAMPFHPFFFFFFFVVVLFSTTCYSLNGHTYIYIHKHGQISIEEGRPEATAINNIELSSFLYSLIDYLDWQATNICMGALVGNASGDQQRQ